MKKEPSPENFALFFSRFNDRTEIYGFAETDKV